MIKNIIFDFDGVILDSVNIKTEAFFNLYEKYGPDISKKVVDYHLLNGGISRYEKFTYFGKNFLNYEYSQSEINNLSSKFENLVKEKVCNASFIKGAYEFIKTYYKKYNFYISTGTPQNEIEYIVMERQLKSFFVGVYGSPSNKISHIKKILSNSVDKNEEYLFIGDSLNDYEAANIMDINFIGVGKNYQLKKISDYFVRDLT